MFKKKSEKDKALAENYIFKKGNLDSFEQLLDILLPTNGNKPSILNISSITGSEDRIDIDYDVNNILHRSIKFGKFSDSSNQSSIHINHIIELAFILRILTNEIEIESKKNKKMSAFLKHIMKSRIDFNNKDNLSGKIKNFTDKNIKASKKSQIVAFLNKMPFTILYFLTQVTDYDFLINNTVDVEASISSESLNNLDGIFKFGQEDDDLTSFDNIKNWSDIPGKFLYVSNIIYNRYNNVFKEIFKINNECKDENQFFDYNSCDDEDKNLKFITLGSSNNTDDIKHNKKVGHRWISILGKLYPFIKNTDLEMQEICLILMMYIDIYHQESFIDNNSRHNSFKNLFDDRNQEKIINILNKDDNSIMANLRNNTRRKLNMYLKQEEEERKYKFTSITNVIQILNKYIIYPEEDNLINKEFDNNIKKEILEYIQEYINSDNNNEEVSQKLTHKLLQNNNYLTLAFILNDYYEFLRKKGMINYDCKKKDSILPIPLAQSMNIIDTNQKIVHTILLDKEGLQILYDNLQESTTLPNKHITEFFNHLSDKSSKNDYLIEYLLAWFIETIYDLGQTEIDNLTMHVAFDATQQQFTILTHPIEKSGSIIKYLYLEKTYTITKSNADIQIFIKKQKSEEAELFTGTNLVISNDIDLVRFKSGESIYEFSRENDDFECVKDINTIKEIFSFINEKIGTQQIIESYVKTKGKEPHIIAYCFINHILKSYEQVGGIQKLSSYILKINYLDNV